MIRHLRVDLREIVSNKKKKTRNRSQSIYIYLRTIRSEPYFEDFFELRPSRVCGARDGDEGCVLDLAFLELHDHSALRDREYELYRAGAFTGNLRINVHNRRGDDEADLQIREGVWGHGKDVRQERQADAFVLCVYPEYPRSHLQNLSLICEERGSTSYIYYTVYHKVTKSGDCMVYLRAFFELLLRRHMRSLNAPAEVLEKSDIHSCGDGLKSL
jgi:hypothetical protein